MKKTGAEKGKKLELEKETLRLLTSGTQTFGELAISIGCTIRTYEV